MELRKSPVVNLAEIGIRSNAHFPFTDLNNVDIPDHLFNITAYIPNTTAYF